ncbi:MAG TPA: cation-transporting P-type ATPase, partial [Chroococcales cyanobacterium]
MIEAKKHHLGLNEGEVLESRRQSGSNAFTPPSREPIWKKFLAKFDDATIKLLLAAAIVSLLVAGWLAHDDGNLGHFIEGIGILLAVAIATGVGLYNDIQSEKAFAAIKKLSEDILVKVTRAGQFHTVQISELVVGDLVHLETGDKIPADGILLSSNEFSVDQSSLTGESEGVKKKEGSIDPSITLINQEAGVCRGTTVRSGNALMKVTSVGDRTEMGGIAQSLASTENLETPLQGRLGKLADIIGKVGMVSAVAIFAALVLTRLVLTGALWHFDAVVMSHLVDYFIIAVTIVVVAVPEGLPMMVTLSL